MIIHIEVICLDSECLKNGLKHYGSTTVGERGQVVLSIEARKKFGIEPGDRLIVLGANAGGFERIILMKSVIARAYCIVITHRIIGLRNN